jgi:RNA polymerase sigma factor (sigma-70 family)
MTDDMKLLWEYVEAGSEAAFSKIVERHIHLVYSVSLRCVRDSHLAEEVTQGAFCILARKASTLNSSTILSAWLCRTARNIALNALTMKRRRELREQEAFMQSISVEPQYADAWSNIEPCLEPLMAELGIKDHAAIVLRFFEGKSFKSIAAELGGSEAAAKMRVNRALEKIRRMMSKQGISFSAAAIAGAVSANSIQAAPIGLAASVTAVALKGTTVTGTIATLIKTTLKIMAWQQAKSIGVISAVAILIAAAGTASLQYTLRAAETASKVFAGYATPEATLKTMTWALTKLDFKKFEEACTPERARQFRDKRESKPEAEFIGEATATAKAFARYEITRKEIISDNEVHLYVRAIAPATDAQVGVGDTTPTMRMKRVGNEWKYDGDVR